MKSTNLLFFILFTSISFGQRQKNVAFDYSHFKLTDKTDTIDFVVADTNLTIKKPVLLFCQGSQPVPLFLHIPEQGGDLPVPLNNFDVNKMNEKYHVVVISMPKTPLIVGRDHLNKSFNYVMDTAIEYSYHPDFHKVDYLENYVDRANKVIKFLMKQKWVDSQKLVVAGHSQGSHVAVVLGATNKKVTQLGLFGFDPLGRIDQDIRQTRKDAEHGLISWEKADSLQNEILSEYKDIHNKDSIQPHSFAKGYKSFSKSQVSLVTKLTIPVYIAYGSHDNIADFCDILPLYFIEQNKTNLTIKRYPNVEHNFFPLKEDGSRDYQNGQWKEVMNSFIEWSER